MACKSDVLYNFGTVSDLDACVHGAARPGAKAQRCFNLEDKVTAQEVGEWCSFMTAHDIKHVISLLSVSEQETYTEPLVPQLQQHFSTVAIEPTAPDAIHQVCTALRAAKDKGEKAVVHCWGGGGRTGLHVAAWLVKVHGLSPEEAAQKVECHAKVLGASRRVDAVALRKTLDMQ